jgi:hypothetical protein
MSLKIHVAPVEDGPGVENGPRGLSVDLELELDHGLLTDPPTLPEKVRALFIRLKASLSIEVTGGGREKVLTIAPTAHGRRPTSGQCQALHAIARTRGIRLRDFLKTCFRVRRPEDLSPRQAGRAIHDLKAAWTSPNGRTNGETASRPGPPAAVGSVPFKPFPP